jgi:hypothetical protein
MFQAIVFLPLLGAILAGLIALAGARARFPGHAPPPGLGDGETDHHASHGHEPSVAMPASSIIRIPKVTTMATVMPSNRPPQARAPRS